MTEDRLNEKTDGEKSKIDEGLRLAEESIDRVRREADENSRALKKQNKEGEKARATLEGARAAKEEKNQKRAKQIEQERLEKLAYAENYRATLREQNSKSEAAKRKREQIKQEEEMRARLAAQKEQELALQKEQEEDRQRRDKVNDILARVGKAVTITTAGEIKPYDESLSAEEKRAVVEKTAEIPNASFTDSGDYFLTETPDEDTAINDTPTAPSPCEEPTRVEKIEEKPEETNVDYTVKVDSDIQKHVLHIAGGTVSEIAFTREEASTAPKSYAPTAAAFEKREEAPVAYAAEIGYSPEPSRAPERDLHPEHYEVSSEKQSFADFDDSTHFTDAEKQDDANGFAGFTGYEHGEDMESALDYSDYSSLPRRERRKLREKEMLALLADEQEHLAAILEDEHTHIGELQIEEEQMDARKLASRDLPKKSGGRKEEEDEMERFVAEQDAQEKKRLSDTRAEKRLRKKEADSLKKCIANQCSNDMEYLKTRVDYSIRNLEKSELCSTFTYGAPTLRERKRMKRAKYELKHIKRNVKRALKYERLDNERYYRLIKDDALLDKLPKGADPEQIKDLTEKLIRLLQRRDSLNRRLMELYLGSGKSVFKKGVKGRDAAELKGRRKEFKRQKPLEQQIIRRRVPAEGRRKLHELMDDRIALCGSLCSIEYILKKEGPTGKARRAFKKERRRIKGALKDNAFDIKRYSKKIFRKAEDKQLARKSAALGVFVLLLLCAAGFAVWYFREPLMQYVQQLIGSFGGGV